MNPLPDSGGVSRPSMKIEETSLFFGTLSNEEVVYLVVHIRSIHEYRHSLCGVSIACAKNTEVSEQIEVLLKSAEHSMATSHGQS